MLKDYHVIGDNSDAAQECDATMYHLAVMPGQ